MLKSTYVRDIAWQFSGNAAAQVLGILALPLLTRLYTPSSFGTLNLFTQIVSALSILITWRYEYLIVIPKEEKESFTIDRIVLTLGLLGVLFFTTVLSVFNFRIVSLIGDPALHQWIVFAPITALLISLSVARQQNVQRSQDYRKSGLSETVSRVAYLGSCFVGRFLFGGIGGLVLAAAFGALAKLVFLCSLTELKRMQVSLVEVARKHFKLASSMSISHAMLAITSALPALFISGMYGSDSLGQFSLVMSTLCVPSGLIGVAIGQVYYQRAAQKFASGETFERLWFDTTKGLVCIGAPIFIVIFLVAPTIYPLVFGSRWSQSGVLASWLAFPTLFAFITTPLDKGCLIVNAWWYPPAWHLLRVTTTLAVVWYAWSQAASFERFLMILGVQMACMYIVDFFASRSFSCRVFNAVSHG